MSHQVPAETPIVLARHGRVYLHPDGSFSPAEKAA